MPYVRSDKNVELFTKHKIFTKEEVYSRCDIMLENYCKVLNIESLTMVDMARKDILPAVLSYIRDLTETAGAKKALSADLLCEPEQTMVATRCV